MRLIRDSSGAPSWTMTLSVPAIVGITLWFITGGIDIELAGRHVTFAMRDGLQYAAAITPWLAFLRTRGMVGTAGAPGADTTTTTKSSSSSESTSVPSAPSGAAKE